MRQFLTTPKVERINTHEPWAPNRAVGLSIALPPTCPFRGGLPGLKDLAADRFLFLLLERVIASVIQAMPV